MSNNYVRYSDDEDLLHCGLDIDTITDLLDDDKDVDDTEIDYELLEKEQLEFDIELSNMTEEERKARYPHITEFLNQCFG
jgi:hypothetical protein